MKLFKRLSAIILLGLMLVVPAFSDCWYVCVGSFKQKQNAENVVKILSENSLEGRILEYQKDSDLYYRVLINKAYDFNDDARNYKTLVQKSNLGEVLGLDSNSFWICQAPFISETNQIDVIPTGVIKNEISAPAVASLPLPEIEPVTVSILESNNEEIQFNEENPYSVLINSYSEEQAAENDKDRLIEKDIYAYVLKKYNDKTYFSFDLHAGAFKTYDEAEEYTDVLDDLGIEYNDICDFEDVQPQIEEYNRVVANQTITYENSQVDLDDIFSSKVKKTILEFPVNKDFTIEGIYIYDFDNIRKYNNAEVSTSPIDDFLYDNESVHAAALVSYKDNLFNKNVVVFIEEAEKGTFVDTEFDNPDGNVIKRIKTQFKAKSEIMDCYVCQLYDGYGIVGFDKDRSMCIVLYAIDFTPDELIQFVNNSQNDSSILVYPQVRKNLLVLPSKNSVIERPFLQLNLQRVGSDYAADRNYADWANAIVNHWEAVALLKQDDTDVSISFFDMDYDYNASQVHGMFSDAHRNSEINDNNYSPDYDKADAWFIRNYYNNEFSFSVKSFIIAIDAEDFEPEELAEIADDLIIWDLDSNKNSGFEK